MYGRVPRKGSCSHAIDVSYPLKGYEKRYGTRYGKRYETRYGTPMACERPPITETYHSVFGARP